MKTPRCSLPDVSEPEMSAGRRKRALAPQNKWNKRHLSWRYIHHICVWNWVIAVRQLYMSEMHSIHLKSKHRGIVAWWSWWKESELVMQWNESSWPRLKILDTLDKKILVILLLDRLYSDFIVRTYWPEMCSCILWFFWIFRFPAKNIRLYSDFIAKKYWLILISLLEIYWVIFWFYS